MAEEKCFKVLIGPQKPVLKLIYLLDGHVIFQNLKIRFKTGFWVPRRAFKPFSLTIFHTFHSNKTLCLILVENPFSMTSCGYGKLASDYEKYHINCLKCRFKTGFWVLRRDFKHSSLAILHPFHGIIPLCLI